MQALIDGDLCVYRSAAFTKEEEGFDKCKERIDYLVNKIMLETEADSSKIFLSSKMNFRKAINESYKLNRKDQERPVFLTDAQKYLVEYHGAEWSDAWLEADDMLGIHSGPDKVICSLDKDLLQVPGKHYQWAIQGTVNGKTWQKEAMSYDVSYMDGLRHVYKQSLIGDTADNIIGVKGIGPAKAAKALENCETERELYDVCCDLYQDDEGRLVKNLCCLWVSRYQNEFYTTDRHISEDFLPKTREIMSEYEKLIQETVHAEEVIGF